MITSSDEDDGTIVQRHYQHRLLRSFMAHLEGCIRFYRDAFGANVLWQQEIMSLQQAHSHLLLSHCLPDEKSLSHRLEGYKLVANH